MNIGFLTSGGDCQALNGAMRGVVKGLKANLKGKIQIYGFLNGYKGLVECNYKKLTEKDFEEILNMGGTILGSSRMPFKYINDPDEEGRNKVECMIDTYKKLELDCLVVLGGNGSHKTANLLSQNGLNVVTLPKTIDNDIYATDITFGFQSAIDVATRYIDEIRTTAKSHGRVFIVEVMGHKTGWLTLHAGIAGAADVILIPEIPYDINKVKKAVKEKAKSGCAILAVAEGIISKEDAKLKKKELKNKRLSEPTSAAERLYNELKDDTNAEMRTSVIGHCQRGGAPDAFDRVLVSRLGAKAAELILNKDFGRAVVFVGNQTDSVPLAKAVEQTKFVDPECSLVKDAKMLGICLGD